MISIIKDGAALGPVKANSNCIVMHQQCKFLGSSILLMRADILIVGDLFKNAIAYNIHSFFFLYI